MYRIFDEALHVGTTLVATVGLLYIGCGIYLLCYYVCFSPSLCPVVHGLVPGIATVVPVTGPALLGSLDPVPKTVIVLSPGPRIGVVERAAANPGVVLGATPRVPLRLGPGTILVNGLVRSQSHALVVAPRNVRRRRTVVLLVPEVHPVSVLLPPKRAPPLQLMLKCALGATHL